MRLLGKCCCWNAEQERPGVEYDSSDETIAYQQLPGLVVSSVQYVRVWCTGVLSLDIRTFEVGVHDASTTSDRVDDVLNETPPLPTLTHFKVYLSKPLSSSIGFEDFFSKKATNIVSLTCTASVSTNSNGLLLIKEPIESLVLAAKLLVHLRHIKTGIDTEDFVLPKPFWRELPLLKELRIREPEAGDLNPAGEIIVPPHLHVLKYNEGSEANDLVDYLALNPSQLGCLMRAEIQTTRPLLCRKTLLIFAC